MSESQLTEDVRAALDESTGGLRVPADAAARARSRGRRRRAGRGLLAVVPAAAVAAGVVVFAHGGSAPASKVTAAPRPAVTVQTDAYIAKRVEAVLSTANNFIIKTSATSGPGQITTSYLDPATDTYRSVVSGAGDKAAYWVQTTVSGDRDHWRTTYVDYTNHTWWTKSSQSGKLGQDTSGILALSADSLPAQIRAAMTRGDLVVAVKGQVNGHAAVELVYGGRLAAKADAVHYWVDARTFEPIRMVMPPFNEASTITESWIHKTRAIVAQTDKPQIPAGYRQVPPSKSFN
ncbi:MAG TPA: hypothetical protein VHZ33_39240 [Trebonia sp.]|jgi:hypothetical protein|nr:hypothetical protein [Trebonia sp.]